MNVEDLNEIKEFLTNARNEGTHNIYSAFSVVPMFFGISRAEAKEAIEAWKKEQTVKA